jgi:hypothetical protein
MLGLWGTNGEIFVTIRLDWKLSDGLCPCWALIGSVPGFYHDVRYVFMSRNTLLSFMKALQSLAMNFAYAYTRRILLPTFEAESFL